MAENNLDCDNSKLFKYVPAAPQLAFILGWLSVWIILLNRLSCLVAGACYFSEAAL